MPYELHFNAVVTPPDSAIYVNECCWGGDLIRDRLRPVVATKGRKVMTEQEDWGWFLWLENGKSRLEVNISCTDRQSGEFMLVLIARRKRFLLPDVEADLPELDVLRNDVVAEVSRWASNLVVETQT